VSDNPAGDFAQLGKRRPRRRGSNRGAAAAELLTNAEDVANSSFLGMGGTTTAPPADEAITSAESPVVPAVRRPEPRPARKTPADESGTGFASSAAPAPAPAEPTATTAAPQAEPAAAPEAGPPESGESTSAVAPPDTAPTPAHPSSAPVEPSSGPHVEAGDAKASAPKPVRQASATRTTAPKKSSSGAKKQSAVEYGPTQQAVWDSYVDGQVNSRQWDTHGVNLIPALWPLLRQRAAKDKKSTGRPDLTMGHYLDAVLRTAPLDANELVALADRLQMEQMGLPKGRKTTLSLSPAAIKAFGEILRLLDEVDYARKGKDVISALVQQLLRSLEQEGPLPKPAPAPLI
jgi:hypothetical protein